MSAELLAVRCSLVLCVPSELTCNVSPTFSFLLSPPSPLSLLPTFFFYSVLGIKSTGLYILGNPANHWATSPAPVPNYTHFPKYFCHSYHPYQLYIFPFHCYIVFSVLFSKLFILRQGLGKLSDWPWNYSIEQVGLTLKILWPQPPSSGLAPLISLMLPPISLAVDSVITPTWNSSLITISNILFSEHSLQSFQLSLLNIKASVFHDLWKANFPPISFH